MNDALDDLLQKNRVGTARQDRPLADPAHCLSPDQAPSQRNTGQGVAT